MNQRTGAARRRASMRSRMPPWPGSMVPEALTPAPRLMADSRRSPSWAAMLRIAAGGRGWQTGGGGGGGGWAGGRGGGGGVGDGVDDAGGEHTAGDGGDGA